MKNKILLGLVVAVLMLSITSMVSAIDIGYSDSYLPSENNILTGQTSGDVNAIKTLITEQENSNQNNLVLSKYPKVEITEDKFLGIFGGNPIMDLELIDHTEYCTVDCYSILKVDMHQKSTLMDELKTKSYINGNLENSNIQTKVYILKNVSHTTEIPKYEEECTAISGTTVTSCLQKIKGYTNGLEWSQEYVLYNNEELDPGNYIVKIEGKKSFNEIVDWIPTIKGQDITALAWWNITNVYGDGSLGDVYFTVSTKTYGNMTINVDYNVIGNNLYLMTDRDYQFRSLYLGPGTTLSTQNITGAAIYIMATNDLDIEGIINLKAKHQPGQFNSTSFSFLGDSFTSPSVASGGSGYAGGGQSGGFGGGGKGGVIIEGGCSTPTGGNGATGGYPFGNGGSGLTSYSNNNGCVVNNGGDGLKSGGGGGTASAYDLGSNCFIYSYAGAGGGSYGANGVSGGSAGSHGSIWSCTSGTASGGGGGAGGSAGQPGYNLVLRGMNLTINNNIDLSGTNGTKGGNGGSDQGANWQSNSWTVVSTGNSGTGGGGGGGASAGSTKIYYRFLTNSSSLNSLIAINAGGGGIGGTYSDGSGSASSGGDGSSGSMTLYQEGFATTILINPQNNSAIVTPAIVTFSATTTPTLSTLVNATFYLWENNTLNNTQFTSLTGITTQTNLTWNRTSAQMPDDEWSWGVTTCYTDGTVPKCYSTQNNSFTTFSVQFSPSSTYDNITYEMTNSTYSMNITSTGFVNLSGTLVWEGVEYPAVTTGNNINVTFTRSIWIPIGTGSKTFNWHVDYGGQLKESTPENVTVLSSFLGLCNSTNNVPFFNINYRDETTNSAINATIVSSIWNYNITGSPYGKQLIFSSPIVNGSQQTSLQHSFCFTPPYAQLSVSSATYQYGNPNLGYSTKIWPFQNLALSNSSTAATLFLINLIDSGTTPVTFQTISSQTNTVIAGVRVQVYREISGTTTLVNDGYTDAAGTISYFMSPITPYTVVAFGGGCNQLTSTITPTSNQYNILLSCTNEAATQFSSIIDGVTYTRTPADGVNTPGTAQYTFNIHSSNLNMTRVKFQLVNAQTREVLIFNSSLTNTANCGTTDCALTLTYTTYTGDNIKGMYYAAINGTADSDLILIEGDAYWRFIKINQNNSVNAIGRLMLNLQDFFGTWGTATVDCGQYTIQATCNAVTECKWINETVWAPRESENYQTTNNFCIPRDDLNKQEFNRIFVIFFLLAILLFILGRTTGYEMNHPGAFVVAMSAVIWILSLYGMFTFNGLTQYPFFNQYIFALTTSCIGAGYGISVVRRYSG